MPYYLFLILLKEGRRIPGIRQLPVTDIDIVWRTYKKKAQTEYRNQLKSFEVVQLSKLDPRVQEWIRNQAPKKEVDIFDEFTKQIDSAQLQPVKRKSGPGKYRSEQK